MKQDAAGLSEIAANTRALGVRPEWTKGANPMQLNESIEQALRSREPFHGLRSFVLDLFSQGKDKAAVLAMFESVRQELREAGREADKDAVMDVMDCLVGWCSPQMKLEPAGGTEPQANGHTLCSENGRRIQQASKEQRGS
jgi:hypothetical protein